jgi:hypothetical protein
MRRLTAIAAAMGLVGVGGVVGHFATVASYGAGSDSVRASSFESLQQDAYARYRCGRSESASRALHRQAELAQSLAANASDSNGQANSGRRPHWLTGEWPSFANVNARRATGRSYFGRQWRHSKHTTPRPRMISGRPFSRSMRSGIKTSAVVPEWIADALSNRVHR